MQHSWHPGQQQGAHHPCGTRAPKQLILMSLHHKSLSWEIHFHRAWGSTHNCHSRSGVGMEPLGAAWAEPQAGQ